MLQRPLAIPERRSDRWVQVQNGLEFQGMEHEQEREREAGEREEQEVAPQLLVAVPQVQVSMHL